MTEAHRATKLRASRARVDKIVGGETKLLPHQLRELAARLTEAADAAEQGAA
jgi:hypothetical protein